MLRPSTTIFLPGTQHTLDMNNVGTWVLQRYHRLCLPKLIDTSSQSNSHSEKRKLSSILEYSWSVRKCPKCTRNYNPMNACRMDMQILCSANTHHRRCGCKNHRNPSSLCHAQVLISDVRKSLPVFAYMQYTKGVENWRQSFWSSRCSRLNSEDAQELWTLAEMFYFNPRFHQIIYYTTSYILVI